MTALVDMENLSVEAMNAAGLTFPTDPAELDALEAEMLQEDQVECPLVHHFGPGVYIREVKIPAGTFALGMSHRGAHLNVMLTGRMIVPDEDGRPMEIVAPMLFIGKPGRKIGFALEDVFWQNIIATEETDLDKIKEILVDRPEKRLPCLS